MQSEKKHFLPVVFIIVIILFLAYYISPYLKEAPLPPLETKKPERILPPLSKEDEALANEVLSTTPEPLSKEDEVTARKITSPENTVRPLTPLEEEQAKKIFGI
jgi:hypothetical protein